MDQIIKIKRSYTQGSIPQTLEDGEIAVNIVDKCIYINDSSQIIRLYDNATQNNNGLLSSEDKIKLDKIITTGNGNQFLDNSGNYKSIISSLVLDYTNDLANFSGTIRDDVISNLQEAITDKIPIFITVSNVIQYIAFATLTDTEIIISIDSTTSLNILSILATINLSTKTISANVNNINLNEHPVILLNYTDDLKNGNLGETVTPEVSKKLLDAIQNGWACVVKSGQSDILCNLQQVRDVVTIVMESITKINTDYFGSTTIIGVNTSTNTISHSDSGGLFLADKDKVLYKDNITEYIPENDYNPATKKYVDSIGDHTVNSKKISDNPILGGSDILANGYQRSTLEGDALQIQETDTINVALGKLEKTTLDNKEIIENYESRISSLETTINELITALTLK